MWRFPRVDVVGLLAEFFELIFVLARGGLGNFTVVLGVDDEHRTFQLGANFFQMGADLVAVAGVIHHNEQHGFFAQHFMLGIALAPFFDTELQVVLVFFGKDGAGYVVAHPGAAGGIRQYRVLDDVLMDSLDQRIIRHGLHEDRAVVVPWRGGHVHLQRKTVVLLQ